MKRKPKFLKIKLDDLKKIPIELYEPPKIKLKGVQEKSPSANWTNVGTFIKGPLGENH